MNRKTIIIILFITINNFLNAQEFNVKGEIITKSKSSKELYEINILNKIDSLVLKSDFTYNNINFNIEKGEYIIQIKALSEVIYSSVIQVNNDLNLGIIQVKNKTIDLDQTIIEGKKKIFEKKIDRLVFNVENSIISNGGDAIDVLKTTPSLKVQNDKISMIGKSKLSVMVDDRLIALSGDELINFLKSIKFEEIKSVEIINNPPAKYDAEGNSGLVNIRLKGVKNNDWSILFNGGYTQANYASENIGTGFRYQKNKLSIISSVNYSDGYKKNTENEKIVYPTQAWNNNFIKKSQSNILSTRIGLEYKISNKWSIGSQYMGSFSNPKSKGININNIFNNENIIDSLLITKTYNKKMMNTNQINLHSLFKIDTLGRNVNFDIDYLNFYNKNNMSFNTQNILDQSLYSKENYINSNSFSVQNLDIFSSKVDFDIPFKWINLKYGGKISHLKTRYDNKYYDVDYYENLTLNTSISNEFIYRENTQSIYISGEKSLSKKWSTQLGFRAENTSLSGYSVTLNQLNKDKYFKIFPSAFLEYKLDDNNTYSLIYNRRLSRPRYNELNPFKIYYNPYSYTEGNPYLKPEFVNNFEIQHSYKNFIFSSFSYSHTQDGKGNPPFFDDETKVLRLFDLNFYSSNVFNLSSTLIFNKIKWLESSNTINLSYNSINFYPEFELSDTKNINFYLSTNNRFVLNNSKTLKGEINYWYQSPQNNDLYKFKESSNLSIGISYILKKSIMMNLVINDILKTNYDRAKAVTNNPYSYKSYNDQRFIRLSISYRLGKNNLSLKAHSTGNEDEKSRINN